MSEVSKLLAVEVSRLLVVEVSKLLVVVVLYLLVVLACSNGIKFANFFHEYICMRRASLLFVAVQWPAVRDFCGIDGLFSPIGYLCGVCGSVGKKSVFLYLRSATKSTDLIAGSESCAVCNQVY